MGYRFSIHNANAVGNLVERNSFSFLQATLSNDNLLETNISFIDKFLFDTTENLYASEKYLNIIGYRLERLRRDWATVKERFYQLRHESNGNLIRESHVLGFLNLLGSILSDCRKKALLLPGFSNGEMDRVMTDRDFLRELVRIHPGQSVLILQLLEFFESEQIELMNTFSQFGTAAKQIDRWPGILLWDDNESMFAPIQQKEQVLDIFQALKFESDAFRVIQNEILEKEEKQRYSYIFHLSDLHFGNKNADTKKSRLLNILGRELSNLDEYEKVITIVTGDLVDSPTSQNTALYSDFLELLSAKGFDEPIIILGNHDVDSGGFFKKLTSEKSSIQTLLTSEYVEIIEDLKLGIVKFNSNFGGNIAQGEIGDRQFMDIGNELDKINREDITYIAILHHHPLPVENPAWYKNSWYEALLGAANYQYTMKLVDADKFLAFIEARNIKLVMHGHKHIPKIQHHKNIPVIAAGSSTGNIIHKEKGKTYLSYNLIKYDLRLEKPVSCTIIAEESVGNGAKNIITRPL